MSCGCNNTGNIGIYMGGNSFGGVQVTQTTNKGGFNSKGVINTMVGTGRYHKNHSVATNGTTLAEQASMELLKKYQR